MIGSECARSYVQRVCAVMFSVYVVVMVLVVLVVLVLVVLVVGWRIRQFEFSAAQCLEGHAGVCDPKHSAVQESGSVGTDR